MKEFKTKESIVNLCTILVLLISLCLIMISCKKQNDVITQTKTERIERKYNVRLSNHIGSEWYECDSVIINNNVVELQNKEDSTSFIKMRIPENVLLRVYDN